MKKISVLLVLLLLGVFIVTSSGCKDGQANGWFTDNITGNRVRFGGRIQLLEKEIKVPPEWTEASATGNFHLVDNSQKVTVQAFSKLKGGDEGTANFLYRERFSYHWSQTKLIVSDCRVNGVKGYHLEIYHELEEYKDPIEDDITITIWDESGDVVYSWLWDLSSMETGAGWVRIDKVRFAFP